MEKESQSYKNIAPLFAEFAQYFDQEVDEDVRQCWESLGLTMRLADSYLDSLPDRKDREQLVEQAASFLLEESESFLSADSSLNERVENLKFYLHALGEERVQKFVANLKKFGRVTEKIKQAKNSKELSCLTRLEGQISARLFSCLIPKEQNIDNENFRKFLKTVTRLGRVANNFDTAIDFKDDYEDGIIALEPNFRNRARLLLDCTGDAFYVVRAMRGKSFFHLAKGIAATFVQKK